MRLIVMYFFEFDCDIYIYLYEFVCDINLRVFLYFFFRLFSISYVVKNWKGNCLLLVICF